MKYPNLQEVTGLNIVNPLAPPSLEAYYFPQSRHLTGHGESQMSVNITAARNFVYSRALTNSPATYHQLGDAIGCHWRDRTLSSALGEISRQSYADYGVMITAVIGQQPKTKHGDILPGEGFNDLSREIAGMVVTDFHKYRNHMQQILLAASKQKGSN